jgi:serine/threonine protein kinase
MELNVEGSNTMHTEGKDDDEKTLSHCLLEHCCSSEDTTSKTKYPLIQALYHHIEQLPQLQAQIHFYTQSLMRGERNLSSSGQALTNPQTRLHHYQEVQEVAAKLTQEWEDHIEALEYIVGEWYAIGSTDIRRQSRSHLGSVWSLFVTRSGGGVKMENTSSSGIRMTLRVLHRILQGTSSKLEKSHEHVLTYHLIPVHRPSSMVLWRDQISLLELYHEPLVQCIAILLQKKPEWTPKVISALLEPDIWTKGGNTPKLVLLLHEIDTYIGILPNPLDDASILGECFPSLLRTLGSCMASDHSRLAERALTFMKNRKFHALIELNYEQGLSILLPCLVRNEPAWNPTVRKMTYNVLKDFQDFDEDRFLRICNKCFPSEGPVQDAISPVVPAAKTEGTATHASKETQSQPPHDFTLKSAMGGWKPPTAVGARHHTTRNSAMPPPSSRAPRGTAAPPLAVTGVAPWAMNRPTFPSSKTSKNPPLGVTGVAPWAVQKKPPISAKRRAGEALSGVVEEDKSEEKAETETSTIESHNGQEIKHPLSRVLLYMEQIKPPEQEDGASSWAKAQMAETPTLLPKLKFHDLVFGHDLGEGAFGCVRYARLIDRSRSRSQWPEYAVKVISTEKIKEIGYETSVQREIAVLRVLSHPGIARLVSSFRFREGVYLMLEYASGGDLHSLLKKNGSLDHDSTRFVMGEVVAALSSIHDMGLVYADLKPENIVITEPGHVKLTDFGGCRPVTEEAKQMIGFSAKNLLKDLRDGDWRPQPKKKANAFDMDVDEAEDNVVDDSDCDPNNDVRIEGTTAYLPPEVVMGGFPTPAADSWALGCVLYQCLSGRPPILEADETLTRNRIVSFDVKESKNDDEALLFSDSHAASINTDARNLITRLLNRHARERPRMNQVAQHDFFVKAGTDVFALYRQQAHPLDVGDVSPVPDAQWSRRQFSSIWAPQPQAYDISITIEDARNSSRGGVSSGPIPEGDEATAFFSKSNLRNISENIPLPLSKRSIEE